MFTQINIVPRWVIFTLDLICCSLAMVFAYMLKFNLNLTSVDIPQLSTNLLLLMLINSIVFLSTKSYSGIIRYTSAQDSIRILCSVMISTGVYFIFNLFAISFLTKPLIPNTVLIIGGLFSFLFLITYRIFIKYIFMYIKNLKLDKKKVIIYGAGEAGMATKRTFDHDEKVNKYIVAFVDDDQRKIGKAIDGVSILDARNLAHLIVKHEIDEIIFASYSIPSEKRDAIVDLCLEHDIKVLNIPPADAWTNGKLQHAQIQKLNIEDLLNRKPISIDIEGIGKMLHKKRILITGAAGSIGSEIVRQLSKFDVGLIILCDQSETALHDLYLELDEGDRTKNYQSFVGDVRDEQRMDKLFNMYRPDYVYHAAAYKHVPLMEDNPAEAIKANVLGTKTVADKSVKYGVQKFVMISTDKAVNPTNIMGASKRIAEIYVQSLNNSLGQRDFLFSNGLSYINRLEKRPVTKFITSRFGNVLGSNGSVIPRFKQQIEKGGPVTVTHPDITRYFMTIPEACRLVLEAGCMGNGGEIFVFDMGKSVRILDLAKKMIKLAGLEPNVDVKIEFSGLRPGEKLYEELLNDNENTMPTHHEKIMIGKVREYVFDEVASNIAELIRSAKQDDDMQVVINMKKMVPEFKSMNSIFEELDHLVN
ncbi:nucleoside-diphosphate sugar epimerase/dehydratase [Pedobacter sp. KBS0701]|uniref:polysaccharide biosynthesis protein n=1 Tax=Pedobacter sp. KBS0701 TaxID=2578106 RepID=UPI001AEFEA88|nr:nucleoside-diphosphate sugar epimerase/dehydratase [Pedobacter sp. KBS0701]